MKVKLLLIPFLLGMIAPFFDHFIIIQFFFLLIPYAVFLIINLILLLTFLFSRNWYSFRIFVNTMAILLIFIFSQIFSAFAFKNIQKARANLMINKMEILKSDTGFYPTNPKKRAGIKYSVSSDKENFRISFDGGFMVTEVYSSKTKKWRAYGWND